MKAKKNIVIKDEPHAETAKQPVGKALVKSPNNFPVVGIGASAGGLDAFKKLLKAIPQDSGMAYVLVQHLDPKHESLLPELLQKVTKIPVMEISDDLRVEPDHIYIIPSNKMMIANDGVLELSPRPAKSKNERNLPIDLFFTSLAEVHQSHAIGVVLSGTASDGTMGLKAIKDHGGITFAQDEESAQYEGMPHSAMEAGVVDFILPPDKIPQKLLEVINIIKGKDIDDMPQQDEDVFKQILSLLHIRKGTDFTYYKQSTIRRRIMRRMAINKTEEPAAYLKYLRDKKPEQDLLYQDLLIPVTEFFRDPEIFDNLCKSVFPHIVKNKKEGEPIRVWVAGCSTGEEVYSIAICFKELLGDLFLRDGYQRVQIFATDISEPAIAKARSGIYSKSDVKGLSEGQLQEYFTKNNGDYQAKKSIRDLCVFAVHNFLKNPPFSKIDFISCRNVLIYMEPYLQKKALVTFHYALNPKGFLLLGKSETTSGVPEHFALCQLKGTVKTDKLFARKDVPGRFSPAASLQSEKSFADINSNSKSNPDKSVSTLPTAIGIQKTADDIMLSKYTPAGVVVNEAMDILHFRGSTGNFLEPSPGKASLNLMKMAKEGLAFELRNILHKAKKENATALKENVQVQINGSLKNINIEAIPLPNMAEPHYLILFHDSNTIGNKQLATGKKSSTKSSKLTPHDPQLTEHLLRIKQLERELVQLREDMRSITEEQEAANEELQSSNEELLSGSEELQSLNEEMETSKEELQSTNEELTVVNQEMIGLNEQLTESRDYAEAIISNLHEPLLVLDKNLRIKTANSSFYKIFQVHEKDTEGKLIYDLGNRQWNIPALRNLLEDILPHKSIFENFEVTHNFPNIGERIVLLNAREIINEPASEKLILLAIEDVTERKQAEKNRIMLSTIVDSSADAIISKTLEGIITSWNLGAEKIFGYSSKEVIGKNISILIPPELKQEEKRILGKIKEGQPVLQYDTLRLAKDGTKLNVSVTISPIKDKDGNVTGASKIARDITEQKQSSQYARSLIEASLDPLVTISARGKILDVNEASIKVTGVSRQKLINTDFSNYFTDPKKAQEGYRQVFEKGFVADYPLTIKHKNGNLTDVLYNASVYKDDKGNVLGVFAAARDVTEQKWAKDLRTANKELAFQNDEKEKRAAELIIANKELAFQNKEKEDRAAELIIANKELAFQNKEKEDRAAELIIANKELAFQNEEKEKRAAELIIANKELLIESGEKEKRAAELIVANEKLVIESFEKERRAHQLTLANIEIQRNYEEHFSHMADLMPDKITTTNADGFATFFNQNWIDYTGYTFEELIGFGWNHITHPDETAEIQKRWTHSLTTGEDFEMEMQYLSKNDGYKWFLTRAVPIKDANGIIISWIGTSTEIQKIKEEEERKGDFIKMVSHELKTPVTSIKGYVQTLLMILEEEDAKISPVLMKSSLVRIDKQVVNLTRLIYEMLDLTRLEAGSLELKMETFSLNDLINEIAGDISASQSKYNIELHHDFKTAVFADRDRIGQVLINFINNAIKYSPNSNKVEIRIYKADTDKVSVSVKDFGIGINKEEQQKIFERFYRVGGKNEQTFPGFGIGLFIANSIIQKHHGSISINSEKGKGSEFIFTLNTAEK